MPQRGGPFCRGPRRGSWWTPARRRASCPPRWPAARDRRAPTWPSVSPRLLGHHGAARAQRALVGAGFRAPPTAHRIDQLRHHQPVGEPGLAARTSSGATGGSCSTTPAARWSWADRCVDVEEGREEGPSRWPIARMSNVVLKRGSNCPRNPKANPSLSRRLCTVPASSRRTIGHGPVRTRHRS